MGISIETALLLVLLGAAVGVFGTLVGAGGGFVLTPVLVLLYPHDSPQTLTTISLTVVFFNAASGSIAYARQRRTDYRSGSYFALATLPGAVAGSFAVGHVPRHVFAAIMGCVLLALCLWLLFGGRGEARAVSGSKRSFTDSDGNLYEYTVPVRRGVCYSLGIGFVSSFLGIGGGVIHVPLMVRALGFPTHVATATSHFVLAWMSGVGVASHAFAGGFAASHSLALALCLSLGVVGGAQVGARVSRRTSGPTIQRLLAISLGTLALRLLVAAL